MHFLFRNVIIIFIYIKYTFYSIPILYFYQSFINKDKDKFFEKNFILRLQLRKYKNSFLQNIGDVRKRLGIAT